MYKKVKKKKKKKKKRPNSLPEQNSTAGLGTGRHEVDKTRSSYKTGFLATEFRGNEAKEGTPTRVASGQDSVDPAWRLPVLEVLKCVMAKAPDPQALKK